MARIKTVQQNEEILPRDPSQALRKLIKISEQVVELAEKETQALVRDDTALFSILQDEKESLSNRYAATSHAFRARLEEFRGADRMLLSRLENLQKQIGERTHSNNKIVERMHLRARKNVQETLVTAQELGQRASFPINENANQN